MQNRRPESSPTPESLVEADRRSGLRSETSRLAIVQSEANRRAGISSQAPGFAFRAG